METKWTLRDIFEHGLGEYLKTHRLPLHLHKAAQAIRRCRTAALGGHIKACPEGHVEKAFYNSCGHRACPQCAYLKTEEWLKRKVDQLLACDHYHLTLTIPSELYWMWRYDYATLANIAFKAARDTIFKLLADPKYMGAIPGLHMTLHTHNRKTGFNPHLHALVTGGGLGPDGTWRPSCRKSLFATEVVAKIFKAKFRDGLRSKLRRGKLKLPPDMNENDALWQLEKALRKKWVVDRQKRYRHGRGVLTYFARYVRGGPLKSKRIESLDLDEGTVTFRESRRHELYKALTLPITELIHRILQHVPPPNFRTSRAYGLYAPNAKDKRERCQAHLGQLTQSPDDPEVQAEIPKADVSKGDEYCPVCGLELLVVAEFPRPSKQPQGPKTQQRPPPPIQTGRSS